jgi:hypothetical protein
MGEEPAKKTTENVRIDDWRRFVNEKHLEMEGVYPKIVTVPTTGIIYDEQNWVYGWVIFIWKSIPWALVNKIPYNKYTSCSIRCIA